MNVSQGMNQGIEIFRWATLGFNSVILAITFPALIRNIRQARLLGLVRIQMFAYVKELQEKGVTVEAHCPYCVHLLPDHVEGCPLEPQWKHLGWVMECLTRPPFQYMREIKPEIFVKPNPFILKFGRGNKPPDIDAA